MVDKVEMCLIGVPEGKKMWGGGEGSDNMWEWLRIFQNRWKLFSFRFESKVKIRQDKYKNKTKQKSTTRQIMVKL